MEKLEFDLTTQKGLIQTQKTIEILKEQPQFIEKTVGASATLDIDIEEMLKDLTNMISNLIEKIFDLFDDTKKLEKQMELAIKTIEISKAAGAKSIDITLNSKSEGKLKVFLKEIDAKIGGKFEKDNTITYHIKF